MALAVFACGAMPRVVHADAAGAHTVVLLHGLARTYRSMNDLADALRASGRRVVNLDYPSTRLDVAELASWLAARLHECCDTPSGVPVDFVTHSLGGILVRALRAHHPSLPIGRVVMLSPPNRGSEMVDVLGASALFRLLFGPAGQELGTSADSAPVRLGEVDFELGVVAGCASINPLNSWLIPGQDDGAVALERMPVQGQRDFVTVHASHSFIMQHAEAIRQTLVFLEHGRFDHVSGNAPGHTPGRCGRTGAAIDQR